MKKTLYALVDCNNFFVSCERLFAPYLNSKPVLVLSSNDGCVVARSQEVKDIGIPMGIPFFKVKKLIQENNVSVFSSNFLLYKDISIRIMNTIESEFPSTFRYSIDEAFIDISDADDPLVAMVDLKKKIQQYCGMPVSIGIASTKTLAKLANSIAKKSIEGVYYINSEEKRVACLHAYSVGQIWGIGRKMTEKLQSSGIQTAYDFQSADHSWVQKLLGVGGVRIMQDLQGIDAVILHNNNELRKSIISSRSFGKATKDFFVIKQAVSHHVASVVKQLQEEKLYSQSMCIHVKNSRFSKNGYESSAHHIYFPSPTQDVFYITQQVLEGLKKIYKKGILYNKAGISAGAFVPEEYVTNIDLFQHDNNKMSTLSKRLEQIDCRYGKNTIRLACEGFRDDWKAKSQLVSPGYTTNWNDLPKCH